MKTKYFIEKSHIVASIMYTKCERLGQNFVTFDELNTIQKELQEVFDNKHLDICITDIIDDNYFNIQDGIILLNDFTLQDIKQKYCSGDDAALAIVWDNNFIIKNILEIRKKELQLFKESISKDFKSNDCIQSTNKVLLKIHKHSTCVQ